MLHVVDLSTDEQALLEKWALLKRIQSSGEHSTAKNQPQQDSEAERRAKLHQAAKQALLSSGALPTEDSSKHAAAQATGPCSSDDDEPLAQPKRAEKKDKAARKSLQQSLGKAIAKHAVEKSAQQAVSGMYSNSEAVAEANGQRHSTQGTASQMAHETAEPATKGTAPIAAKNSAQDIPVATGKCELVYDDI
eukprot:jgi/Ulvmu1/12138/UM085_0001.1